MNHSHTSSHIIRMWTLDTFPKISSNDQSPGKLAFKMVQEVWNVYHLEGVHHDHHVAEVKNVWLMRWAVWPTANVGGCENKRYKKRTTKTKKKRAEWKHWRHGMHFFSQLLMLDGLLYRASVEVGSWRAYIWSYLLLQRSFSNVFDLTSLGGMKLPNVLLARRSIVRSSTAKWSMFTRGLIINLKLMVVRQRWRS